jgi:predicted kinase
LRLEADDWTLRIVGPAFDDAKHEIVKSIQLEIALRTVQLGIHVVLEGGMWFRAERDAIRTMAAKAGCRIQLHFLDVPLQELQRRLAARNATKSVGTYRISDSQLALWATWFEPPTPDEFT